MRIKDINDNEIQQIVAHSRFSVVRTNESVNKHTSNQ